MMCAPNTTVTHTPHALLTNSRHVPPYMQRRLAKHPGSQSQGTHIRHSSQTSTPSAHVDVDVHTHVSVEPGCDLALLGTLMSSEADHAQVKRLLLGLLSPGVKGKTGKGHRATGCCACLPQGSRD